MAHPTSTFALVIKKDKNMFIGMTTFVCDNCGHKFKGMGIEWQATALAHSL